MPGVISVLAAGPASAALPAVATWRAARSTAYWNALRTAGLANGPFCVFNARYTTEPEFEVTNRPRAEALPDSCASWAGATKEEPKAYWSVPESAISRCEITESSWDSCSTIAFGSPVRTWSLDVVQCGLRDRFTATPDR